MLPGSCTILDIIDRHSRQHSELERDRELPRCFFGRRAKSLPSIGGRILPQTEQSVSNQ